MWFLGPPHFYGTKTRWEMKPPKKGIGEGNGTPLQCSCLENSMDGGAWRAIVHGVSCKESDDWATSLSLFLSSAICKASSNNHFAFLDFFFLGMVLTIVSWSMSRTSVHSSSGTLPIRSNSWNLICHFNCIIIRYLILVIQECSSWFLYFLQLKCEFCNKEFMIWVTVSSQYCICWLCCFASASLAAKNIINLILILTIWWCPCVESSLVLLKEGVCYGQCILLAKLC